MPEYGILKKYVFLKETVFDNNIKENEKIYKVGWREN